MPGFAASCERFENLLRELRRRGDRPCLLHGERRISYEGLEDLRRVWGCRLRDAGARPGEVVGLEADWSPDAVAVLLAILAKGSAAALLPPGLPEADGFLRGLGAIRGFRQAGSGAWSLEERLPPFADFPRPREATVILADAGPRPLGAWLAATGPGRADRVRAEAPFASVEGVDLLLAVLAGGGCLVLPEYAAGAGVERARGEGTAVRGAVGAR